MPSTAMQTFTNDGLRPVYPHVARTIAVTIKPSSTLVAGTVLGQLTATSAYAAYASGNSDGTEIPKGFLAYDAVTDANGNITPGAQAGGGEHGETRLDVGMFITGEFKTPDLTGLDANAVDVLQGRYVSGDLADGILHI